MEAKFDGKDLYRKIKSLTGAGLDAIAEPAMQAGGKVFKIALQEAVSVRGPSLQQLADMDHPYARRGGAIKINGGKPLVHTRSGQMLAALKVEKQGKKGIRIGFDESIAPHASYVIQGTRVMLPRDVFRHVYSDDKKALSIVKAVGTIFNLKLRSKYGQ